MQCCGNGEHGSVTSCRSTGVWKALRELVVTNAQHIKKVPGRKTDVQDAEWIADLLQHGLLAASFVPRKAATRCTGFDTPADQTGPRTGSAGQSRA